MLKKIIRYRIDEVVGPWLKERGIETVPLYSLEEPPKNIDADLACNLCMMLSKQLKSNPRKIAEELSALIAGSLKSYISAVDIAGAGFLNLKISDELLYSELKKILDAKPLSMDNSARQGTSASQAQAALGIRGEPETQAQGEKLLLEFVSANPTGPLHIGHGRGAAIGDSIARIYSYLGRNISREYYLNDIGNQMDLLGQSVEARYKELKGKLVEFPENGYKGHYIKEIAEKLEKTYAAKIIVTGTTADFTKFALTEIIEMIKSDLAGFDVHFDTWFSESTIIPHIESVCDLLKQKELAYEDQGALWFASTRFGDDKDRVLRRSDGRYTYLASDIAYHKNKIDRGFTELIDIWGADHHGYVPRMKAAMESLSRKKDDLKIILYQLVSLVREGKPVSMSTRAGEFVALQDVVDEVGKDACRFFFLLRAPDSQLEFDLELAKKQSKENPVYYVQYVHARCCSILRESKKQSSMNDDTQVDLSLLKTSEERALIKKLLFLQDVVELCAKNLSPHYLTTYLMEVADLYHRFYERCRVLTDDKSLTCSRLLLIKSVASIVKTGLNLVGVSAPEKM